MSLRLLIPWLFATSSVVWLLCRDVNRHAKERPVITTPRRDKNEPSLTIKYGMSLMNLIMLQLFMFGNFPYWGIVSNTYCLPMIWFLPSYSVPAGARRPMTSPWRQCYVTRHHVPPASARRQPTVTHPLGFPS